MPVPGGPTRRTPLGIRAPNWVYWAGWRRKSTTSASSSFSSSAPATSLKVTVRPVSARVRARALPNWAAEGPPPPPPWARRKKRKYISRDMTTRMITQVRMVLIQAGEGLSG